MQKSNTYMGTLFQRLWAFAMRDEEVAMEVALFRLVTLCISLLCIFFVLPTNFIQNLSPYLNLMIGIYGLAALCLYRASCRGRHYYKAFYLLTLLTLTVAWFLNAGSAGSIGYYLFATLLYPLVFFRGMTRQIMLFLLVSTDTSLLLVEARYPHLVLPYHSNLDRLIDLVSGFSFSAVAGGLIFWVVVTVLERELDERKQMQLSLAESENTLKVLMDSMPCGIWWFKKDGSVEYSNHCFREMFGYTMEEIPTHAAWAARAEHDREGDAAFHPAEPPLPHLLRESKITCKDGSVKHVIVSTQQAMGRTVEIFTDITEREVMKDQMLRVQKLESLSILAGGIAHDFNNILTSIMGNISFARMVNAADHESGQFLQQAEIASQRAAQLAKQLLTFAKGGKPVKAPVDIAPLLEESLTLSLRGSNVQGVNLLPRNLPVIEGDEGQLSQAFNNIIINAVHAMPKGGTVTVSGERVALDSGNPYNLKRGDYLRIAFTDVGLGISESDQKNIFDPYFSTKAGASGLGLASTYSIITRHGGSISVESSPGEGAVFTLHLPAPKRELSVRPVQDHGLTAHLAGGSILIMDDEEMIRSLTEKVLTGYGYQVETCSNGEDAILCYRRALEKGTPYSLVILDLTIPGGMGGKDAAQEILRLDADARLVVSSGYSNDLTLDEWEQHGFKGILTKPYHAADLLRAVAEVATRC